MKRIWIILPLLLALCWFTSSDQSFAREKDGSTAADNVRLYSVTQQTANRTLVNVGQLAMWIYSNARSARDPGGDSGVYFPRGNTPNTAVIFQDGLVWGGMVNDGSLPALRVGGGTYVDGNVPGAILGLRTGNAEDVNDRQNVDRIWKIRSDYPTADLRQDAAEINQTQAAAVTEAQIADVRALYKQDWIDWPASKGAPFYDVDGDGQYNPGFRINEEGIEVPKLRPGPEEEFNPDLHADEPGIAGADQVVWLVVNDLSDPVVRNLYGSPPIGIETQITLWAYRRADALGQIIFKQFRFIYKGTATTPGNATVDPMYVCQWSDPDLGSFGDDFVGSDTTLSLGYAYNSSSQDAVYASVGLPPPASGYDFFAGPLVPSPGDSAIFGLERRGGFRNLPMTTFGFFAAGGEDSDPDLQEYDGTRQWWNLLRGFRPRPEEPPVSWENPITQEETNFVLTGDPVTGDGWVDSNPGDRRLLLASGPFTLALGDTQETVVALLAGLGSDRLSSVSVLKFVDRFAQEAFDALFVLPSPPPTPALQASELENEILLNWGFSPQGVAATEAESQGFVFEGYNVYQLPNAGARLDQSTKVATFDVVNEVTVITQETFDQQSGLVLELPVQQGRNSGVQRTFSIDRDFIRERSLVNGQTYYFGVSAYSFNPDPDATVKTLESPPAVVTVVPQSTKPGVRAAVESGATLDVEHTGPSDGTVTPVVVDPLALTGDTYQVTFEQVEGETVWDLTNTTTGEVLLNNQTNQSGDANYLIIDGVQVVVAGPPPGVKQADMFDNEDPSTWGWDIPSGTRRFTWAGGADGFGFEGFRGAIGWACPVQVFFGEPPCTEATTLKPVLLQLATVDTDGNFDPNDPNVSFGYRYLRGATAAPAQPEFAPFITNPSGGYAFQAFEKNIPLSAWDISDPDNPRRLVVGFMENNAEFGLVDGKYWPPNFQELDNTAGDGPREWLFIYDADYSETQQDEFAGDLLTEPFPIMYWLTIARRGDLEFSPGGSGEDQFAIFPNIPNSTQDSFTFTALEPTQSTQLAKEDALELINVFPNPYLGFNAFENNRFQRRITFSHLPQRATIRIFNLAGVLVRTLEKDDASQFIDWNLQNEDALPVASGLYIAHIEMPELGATKILKLALVQEEQFLRNF